MPISSARPQGIVCPVFAEHSVREIFSRQDLAQVRFASTPDLLRDFGRWQEVAWKRDTLSLH